MPSAVNRQVLLAARPTGAPKPSDFKLVETAIPEPGPGEVEEDVVPDSYLDANRKRRKKPRWGRAPRVVEEGVFPTWREAEGELSILFVHSVSAERERTFDAIDPWECQKGPCNGRPRVATIVETQRAGALLGYEVSYDRKGARVREQFFGPTPTSSSTSSPAL